MKVIGFDNKIYSLTCNNSFPRISVSSLHLEAKQLLKQIFPSEVIFEEVGLPGSSTISHKGQLFVDFLIPTLKLALEVQGEQHYKFNSHFFDSQLDFKRAQLRDKDKKRWCTINGIVLVELPFNKIKEWKDLILKAYDDN